MGVLETFTYEHLYYSLWEIAQRYSKITQFRVIGKSHDDRMIPMVELGSGEQVLFCLAGFEGTDQVLPFYLLEMLREYCNAYECGWQLRDFYDVKELLAKTRLCFIPIINPDGFEIGRRGYSAIRNPIFRQMLRMQQIPEKEYECNARGVDIRQNFPTTYSMRKRISQEPASENETKALIRIFQEYQGRGLLVFSQEGKRIVYYRYGQSYAYNQKSYRLARHLQKSSHYRLEKHFTGEQKERVKNAHSTGSPEQFYAEICKQPSIRIEIPDMENIIAASDICKQKSFEEIHTLPLEYIFSF